MRPEVTNAAERRWWEPIVHGPPTPTVGARAVQLVFTLWAVAFLLKHAGSSWDVAWHFRYPFGVLEPPHLVNVAGSALAITLLVFQSATGIATDRRWLPVAQIGFVIFLIAIPLDLLNHWMFGLDITTWSPTHLLQFAGTTILAVGVLQSWLRLAAPGRWRTALGVVFWAFLLDDALFMLSQQEYGVLALDAYAKGRTLASPELLALARGNPVALAQGNIPPWVYPIWLILSSTLVLALARPTQGWRWTATAAAMVYLIYRVVGYVALGAVGFPQSFVPYMLLGGAVTIDLGARWRWHPLLTVTVLTVVYYAAAAVIGKVLLMPEFARSTAPVVLVALWAGVAAGQWWQRKRENHIAAQAA